MEELFFDKRSKWRKWLEKNHDKSEGIWIIYYKKHTKKPTLSYNEAVEEALCFGWIDSKVNRIDEERYRQVFTPRNKKSIWSLLNTQRVEKLIQDGKMTEAGLKKVKIAKETGAWDKAYSSKTKPEVPKDLIKALNVNKLAFENFNNFTNSQQMRYVYWINEAKRDETRIKRINQVVQFTLQNIKPAMT